MFSLLHQCHCQNQKKVAICQFSSFALQEFLSCQNILKVKFAIGVSECDGTNKTLDQEFHLQFLRKCKKSMPVSKITKCSEAKMEVLSQTSIKQVFQSTIGLDFHALRFHSQSVANVMQFLDFMCFVLCFWMMKDLCLNELTTNSLNEGTPNLSGGNDHVLAPFSTPLMTIGSSVWLHVLFLRLDVVIHTRSSATSPIKPLTE